MLFIGFLVLAGGCSSTSLTRLPAENRILADGVCVMELPVGGLTVAQARNRLADSLPSALITLSLPEQTVRVEAGAMGITYDLDAMLLAAIRKETDQQLQFSLDKEKLHTAVNAFSEAHSTAAADATYAFVGSSEEPINIEKERIGVQIDADALYLSIVAALEKGSFFVDVPCTVTEPAVKAEQLASKHRCIGTYTTSFARSPQNAKNRVFNIEKAAKAIDGLVLGSGETFDCNAALGDRTAENGWREAAGIRNGRYVQEFGGGVCQLSSTLFNAVLYADLTVTERYPHSWPMSYVPIGRDATISTGGKNFCFVNDTDAPITLAAYVDHDASTLTVSIYGTPKRDDGSRIEIVSEQTGTLAPLAEEILLDESLPYGTRNVERDARRGKTSKTYRERYDADGDRIERTLLYADTYRSIAARIYVSTDLFPAQTDLTEAE